MSPEESEIRNSGHEESQQQRDSSVEQPDQAANEEPDVVLDVPQLKGDEISLAFAEILKLEIKGVEAQLLLKADLENVVALLQQILTTIGENPEALQALRQRLGELAGSVGKLATRAVEDGHQAAKAGDAVGHVIGQASGILTESVNESGHVVRRAVDESGNIVETTLDESGEVIDEDIAGNLSDLPVEEEYTDDKGRTVRRVRDGSGTIIEETLDDAGDIVELDVAEEEDTENQ